MSRTLQTSTVYFSRVSYLVECNANDTYVLRMTQINKAHIFVRMVLFWTASAQKFVLPKGVDVIVLLVLMREPSTTRSLYFSLLFPHNDDTNT